MKHFKRLMVLFILIVVTACNINTITWKKQSIQWHQEWDRSITFKTMPKQYAIDPLPDLYMESEAAILIHAATGDVLFEKNIHQSLPVASMSKIMTELLVLEALHAGTIDWEDNVSISDYAHTISHQPGYASVHLQQDMDYTVRELFHAMAIRSANGATIALAERVGGNEQVFVRLMNEKAQELGLNNTYFFNSTGLTNSDLLGNHTTGSGHDKNRMSAKDLATLAIYVIERYPEILEITKRQAFDFHGQTHLNSNWMLPGLNIDLTDEDVTYTGVDGLKTGFTDDAGYGFTGTVLIDDRRFISVIIGTKEIEDRFLETKMLYDAVLQQLENNDG